MKRILFSVCLFAFFLSCNSNDDTTISQEPDANFYALTVGNSWVYKYYHVNNELNVNQYVQVVDSVEITGTELINDNLYYKFKSNLTKENEDQIFWRESGESFKLLRDSIGYLINETGFIEFTNNDFNERLHFEEEYSNGYATLLEGEVIFETEAGNINSLEMLIRYESNIDGSEAPFKNHFYYSDGIGLISDDYGFIANDMRRWQRRLDSYNIQ